VPGNRETLVARHDGNLNAAKSGIYSRTGRVLAPRVEEVARLILAASHTHDLDELGAREIARLVVLIETVDDEIDRRGLTTGRGSPRTALLDIRLRASGRLERWLSSFGMTPRARAELLGELGRGALAAEIVRRRKTEK
jgi:hypothetical protein